MSDRETAKETLLRGSYTCVFARAGQLRTDTARGVSPLLSALDSGQSYAGWSAADRVVGLGAAFLYVLLGVREVWAGVMSRGARTMLEEHGITCFPEEMTESIRNRAGDGVCPMEEAVSEIDDPLAALAAIRAKRRELMQKKQP